MEWQPIETAPRDGTTILVSRYNPTWGWIVGYARWSETRGIGGWISHGFYDPPGNLGLAHPTHWALLPPPPGEAPAADLPVRNRRPPETP